MALRYLRVVLLRSEHETLNLTIPPWELPVLEAVHGEELIDVKGEELVDRDPPAAEDEFERLMARFGEHRESGTPWVVAALGPKREAVKRIDGMIAEATALEPEPEPIEEEKPPREEPFREAATTPSGTSGNAGSTARPRPSSRNKSGKTRAKPGRSKRRAA